MSITETRRVVITEMFFWVTDSKSHKFILIKFFVLRFLMASFSIVRCFIDNSKDLDYVQQVKCNTSKNHELELDQEAH